MFSKFKAEACEIQCRLCLGRIKLMRNKRGLQLKQSRKDVAELLRSGKQEYARIRVEGVIREQLMLQAYEVLELYMELLTVRAQLVAKTKEIPRDMVEAISSIIYAAERVGDFPELHKLRKMFETKYGPEYVREATNDATRAKWQVNQNLIRCLLVEAPQPEEKLAALSEIAQEHGVEWDLSAAARDMLPPEAAPSISMLPGAAPTASAAPQGSIPMMPLPTSLPQQQYGAPAGYGYGAGSSGGGGAPTYTDANQAAAAAAHAANQAKAAADYAAQFALHQAGLVAPAAPPSDGWLAQQAQQAHHAVAAGMPPPAPPSSSAGSLPSYEPGAAGLTAYTSNTSAGGAGQQPGAGAYTGRSNEEIQRAYDEALGAPSKHTATAPAPPAPEPRGSDLPSTPNHFPKPPPAPAVPSSLNLPVPPASKVQPGAPAPEDEYEALTKRLEALKRS